MMKKAVTYSALDLPGKPECRNSVSVGRMAFRWYLEPSGTQDPNQPDMLLAPRFGPVPPLLIDNPFSGEACNVFVTLWTPEGWFSHLRVSYPGCEFPVTVAHPVIPQRPGYEEKTRAMGAKRLFRTFVRTLPAGAEQIEISKNDAMEACLVSVTFEPAGEDDKPLGLAPRIPDAERPIVVSINDPMILAETLQDYGHRTAPDFYRQMRAMGFTHIFQQVYGGSASWSEAARPWKPDVPYGQRSYANWIEPEGDVHFIGVGSVSGLQGDFDRIRAAGLHAFASFRINNEWLADWALRDFKTPDGGIPDSASVFSVEHPEWHLYYRDLKTTTGSGMDFSFSEVRAQRLAVIREWCDKFHGFDGICIDLHRHPRMVGYPPHLVAEFHNKFGIDLAVTGSPDKDFLDERWLKMRAEYFTMFLREVRKELSRRHGPEFPLAARVGNTFQQALLEGADIARWLEEGLVGMLVLNHRAEGSASNPLDADSRPIIEAAHAADVLVIPSTDGAIHVDFEGDDISGFAPHLDRWRNRGADGFCFYEGERAARDGRWLRGMPKVVAGWKAGRDTP